uniref:tRNA-dihydrouridine synthase n=1 Tax=Acrobeloides nanus TaxID=290746 RepID=A0A914EBS6_9BILA
MDEHFKMNEERIIVSKENDCKLLDIPVPIFICAPMVRYSKLPFRKLVKQYGCDLTYTPMIYASCFLASEKCRNVEFTTEQGDNPIVQFAAKTPVEFADAAELVYSQSRGIDLNCGCPKRDVRSGGFGSQLLDSPELIADIVRQTRARISNPEYSISVKIRIQYPLEKTISLCQQIEKAGATHISIHGRTRDMRNEMPDYEAISLVKSSIQIPVYANGGIKNYEEALSVAHKTKVDGIMVADALLSNPALFGGHLSTPKQCIRDWLEIEANKGISFESFHQHLIFMVRSCLPKAQRIFFNELTSTLAVKDFLSDILLS